jgi:hypothetical protein
MKLIVLKPTLLLTCIFCFALRSFCQDTPYWQQQVNYDINVQLNDQDHTLDGALKMEYINYSPDTLRYIWLHLWPNAYKNDRTAFTDQALENGSTDFYFSGENDRGYINRLNFKVNDTIAAMEDHPQHQDIVKLILPAPLLPGAKIFITTPFHVKLPYNFSRGGHIGQSYQLTQWYPKPAVYDRKGWHPMPYLDQGEFYSEFGNYRVQVTVPAGYVVAATGKLQNETTGDNSFLFLQDRVHDFAWFAAKDFIVAHDTLQLRSKVIDVYAYYTPKNEKLWANSIRYIKNAISTKSEWLGEYPYDVVSVVERPGRDMGGMEYPTITLVSPADNERDMDFLINHEVGHNWFYGILATNEREHPWMDEGMNSFYDRKYSKQQYGKEGISLDIQNKFLVKRMPDDVEDLALRSVISVKKDQPIETPSERFSAFNYNIIPYTKTALWMQLLQSAVGDATFDSIMHAYYQRWQFKHPYPEDFKQVAQTASGKNLDSIFVLLDEKGSLKKPVKKDLKAAAFFSFKDTDKHHYIFLAPAAGYNFYDKFMLGAIIHNYTLPQPKLQFFAAPLFSTGSKKINGTGRISYSLYPGNNGQKLEMAIAASAFTADIFTDSTHTKHYLDFSKMVPSLKFVFANKDPRSTVTKYIQWKTFLVQERSYLFTNDTTAHQYIITYPMESRYLHQLKFVVENNRKLYPFRTELSGEKGDGFIKANFTANYFFNYAKGGGLSVRFFAGKFFYTGDRLASFFKTYRYHLNMTGANGYEDYTYSNYFIGRNEFEGLLSQQIMIKDGGFKVRTDLLSNKFGRTDDWLSAANFSTDIPKKVFPLPLKLFADIGTYAEAWKKDAPTGKFVYDAGIQLALFKNVINIYIPVLYSKAYKDYFKSYISEKRFQKSISFSIDIQNLSTHKLFPQLPL